MTPEKLEFPIEPKIGVGLISFVYSQLFVIPEPPHHSFTGQTIIVTGANSGLGLEAARHFYRLNCAKLILAVRTPSKGEAAKEDIVRSVKSRSDGASAIEVWPVDISSTKSTLAFAERFKNELPRVDVLLENAGVNAHGELQLCEGFEMSMQINVLNTFLLALSLLPKLRETKAKFSDSLPHLVIVGSDAHRLTKFTEINSPDIYEAFNDKRTFTAQARYQDGKLLQVLLLREIVSRLNADKSSAAAPVVMDIVSPGLCVSDLGLGLSNAGIGLRLLIKIFYRTAEVGSRTLVHAASAGMEAHDQYLVDCKNVEVESWIYTDMGKRAQLKAYEQTMRILESRKPGIAAEAGLL